MSTTTLYRMFAADGRLLYVGISSRAALRWEHHRQDKPWWNEVNQITVEHYPGRGAALVAEAHAIRSEHPQHNIAGVDVSPLVAEQLPDELQRPKCIGLGTLAIRWPAAERLAEQHWQVLCSRYGTWGCGAGRRWYPDKRAANESLSLWADSFEDGAVVLPESWEPQ